MYDALKKRLDEKLKIGKPYPGEMEQTDETTIDPQFTQQDIPHVLKWLEATGVRIEWGGLGVVVEGFMLQEAYDVLFENATIEEAADPENVDSLIEGLNDFESYWEEHGAFPPENHPDDVMNSLRLVAALRMALNEE